MADPGMPPGAVVEGDGVSPYRARATAVMLVGGLCAVAALAHFLGTSGIVAAILLWVPFSSALERHLRDPSHTFGGTVRVAFVFYAALGALAALGYGAWLLVVWLFAG